MTVENDFREVVQAVRAILDSSTLNQERKRCTEKIEELKESDPATSVPIAFKLLLQDDLMIGHVGWNIIEHVIRYKWTDMSGDIRIVIRNGVLEQMSSGKYSLTSANLHVKTCISRSLVAMMEQEWPQNWPELFEQFKSVVLNESLSPQAQMVFIVLKRLIENVITYSTVTNPLRRKELSTSINNYMPEMLRMTVERIRMCIQAGNSDNSILVAKAAIELLSESVDWVVGRVLEEYVDSMIEVLCAYLQTAEHGMYEEAATCLWKIASRKRAKTDETPIVLSMFKDAPMRAILSAASLAAEVSSSSLDHYKYLKALCDLLTALGVHLSEIWGYVKNPPPNFSMYLSAISSFFIHPSMSIRSETSQVLVTFASHEHISVTSDFVECTKQLIPHIPKNLEKIGSMDDADAASLTSHYAKMDYTDDVEFQRDFVQLRDRVCRFIRESCTRHCDQYMEQLTGWIQRIVTVTDNISTSEWEAVKKYVTTCVQAAYHCNIVDANVDKIFVFLFNSLMNRIVSVNNPSTANLFLSIPSSFLQLFDKHADLIPPYFQHLKCILMVDSGGQDIVNLKRHAISLMLKVCSTMPNAIESYAESILNIVKESVHHVSTMQRANLVQVLGALSNLVHPNQRLNFLQSAVEMNIEFIRSPEFLSVISSTENFLAYIGLTSAPDRDTEEHSTWSHNRLQLKAHLCALDGMMSQVNSPSDQPNPLFELLGPILGSFFQIADCLNSLKDPLNVARIHSGYDRSVVDISAVDRHSIYCTVMEAETNDVTDNVDVNSTDRLRRYLSDVTDMIQSITGLCGSKLFFNFYALPNLQTMLGGLVQNLNVTMDFRIRYWIRRTWRPIICCCPLQQIQVIIPFTAEITRHLQERFSSRWAEIDKVDYDAEPTKEEIFMEHMTCVMSREYAQFLKFVFLGEGNVTKDDTRKDPLEALTERGRALLSDQAIMGNVVLTLCGFLNCPDTQTAIRTVPIARTVFAATCDLFDSKIAEYVLIQTIQSLQVHGADEVAVGPLLSLIFQVYVKLRPRHASLLSVLQQVPEATPETLQAFDERVQSMARVDKVIEKHRRDIMRKFLRPVIAKNVGEQFKRPSHLRTLQPLSRLRCNGLSGSSPDVSFEGLFAS